jgi:hypothetical protein
VECNGNLVDLVKLPRKPSEYNGGRRSKRPSSELWFSHTMLGKVGTYGRVMEQPTHRVRWDDQGHLMPVPRVLEVEPHPLRDPRGAPKTTGVRTLWDIEIDFAKNPNGVQVHRASVANFAPTSTASCTREKCRTDVSSISIIPGGKALLA